MTLFMSGNILSLNSDSGVQWHKLNILSDGNCHPGSYQSGTEDKIFKRHLSTQTPRAYHPSMAPRLLDASKSQKVT